MSGLVVFVLMLIWHRWRVIKLEDSFTRQYEESEECWLQVRNAIQADIIQKKQVIEELESDKAYLSEKIEKSFQALKGNYPGSSTRHRQTPDPYLADPYLVLNSPEFPDG